MSRRIYRYCPDCKDTVLVYGERGKKDAYCSHIGVPREIITPTVYYENAQGEVWSGPDALTPCPLPGYQRKEVQAHEIRRFEKLMTSRMQDEHRRQLENQREVSEAHQQMRAQARREMDAEILKEAEGMDAESRAFLHHAMEHRDEAAYTRNFDPNFHVGAWK